MVNAFITKFEYMTFSRAILLLLLLPLAARADISAQGRHVKHRPAAVSSAQVKKTSAKTGVRKSTTARSSSEAASRLAGPAVDVIPAVTRAQSLYNPQTAPAPESGTFLGLFGPKADGIRYDARMIRAAQIAEQRARQHSIRSCWRYVKEALLAANVVDTYPGTTYAKQAGDELIRKHGFRRLSITDPFKAPVGAVLVYGGRGAGHVEIRTRDGFVSDFESPTPSRRPLLGIFVKPT